MLEKVLRLLVPKLAVAIAVAALSATATPAIALPASSTVASRKESCIRLLQSNTRISRRQLSQFMNLPQGIYRGNITRLLGSPYCLMLDVRGYQREAYPFDFDPSTWLIVLYEGEQYAGYDFNYQVCGMGAPC